MFNFLTKIFIKNKDDVNNVKVRTAYGILCSTLGIITNLVLSAAKIIIGILSASISIIADGIDNLSDSASNVTTLIGFKLAAKPADPEHPFGHERIEYLCGLFVSILVLVIGILLGKSSIEKIISKDVINIERFTVLVIVLVLSILVKAWQSLFYLKASKKINSSAIKATSQDSLNDCIKTFVVLLSVVIFKIWNLNVDAWFGLAVAIYILINGIGLVKDTISPLIGEAPNSNFSKSVMEKILSYEGVLGVHDLVIHSYGPAKTFITVHVEVDSRVDVLISHDIIDNIERDFFEKDGYLVTVHMDPIQIGDKLTDELKAAVEEIILEIDQALHFHDFRIVKGITHINVLFDVVVPPKFKMTDFELKQIVEKRTEEQCFKLTSSTIHAIVNVDKSYVL